MKGKAIIPLVLGLGIGIFAIKMFFSVLNKAKGSTGETVQVVRAKVDIMPTLQITEQMLEMASVPESLCPKLAARSMEEVVGRVTANSIPQGCPIVSSLLAPKGTLPGMAARIKDGYRAVAVKVDESVGVAGWVKPGSRVDVVAVMTGRSGSKNEVISRVILQDVEVLAVGQDSGITGENAASVPKSVTLQVLPDDVPKLHLAATKGALRLAMRNQSDDDPLRAASASDDEILGINRTTERSVRQPGFLDGLFSNLRKMPVKPTDKRPVATKPAAEPRQVVAAPRPGWIVQVMNGDKLMDICFTGSGKHDRTMASCNTSATPSEAENKAPQTVATAEKPATQPSEHESIPPVEGSQEELEAVSAP